MNINISMRWFGAWPSLLLLSLSLSFPLGIWWDCIGEEGNKFLFPYFNAYKYLKPIREREREKRVRFMKGDGDDSKREKEEKNNFFFDLLWSIINSWGPPRSFPYLCVSFSVRGWEPRCVTLGGCYRTARIKLIDVHKVLSSILVSPVRAFLFFSCTMNLFFFLFLLPWHRVQRLMQYIKQKNTNCSSLAAILGESGARVHLIAPFKNDERNSEKRPEKTSSRRRNCFLCQSETEKKDRETSDGHFSFDWCSPFHSLLISV